MSKKFIVPYQNISDIKHKYKYTKAIKQANLWGINSFQNWFDKSKNVDDSILKGYWDLTFCILTPKVCEYIKIPEEKIALEIGYGGGRILNAACSYFKKVIGIDIHNNQETVKEFLKLNGKNNFKLIETSGRTINVNSESIDFVYSFIVLQHLPSFDVFVNYIKETYRSLKSGGVAQLYFGKYSILGTINRLRYFIQGYKEISKAPVNHISLVIRISKVKKLCKNIGFEIIETGTSYKRVPDGYPKLKGRQNYITLLKK